jgi:ribosomal protein S18 acetylase RimI-like enzyme
MDLASADLAELLPEGAATPGNEVRSVMSADGQVVGSVWLGPKGPGDTYTCVVWDIHIEPAVRGRGFGRAAMLEAEALAGRMGYARIELHVFGDNTVARQLYRSLGYIETDIQMRRELT